MDQSGSPASESIWKPLVVCPHPELSSKIRMAFSELGIAQVQHLSEYPRMGSLAATATEQDSNLCVVDVASNPEHALLLIGEACADMPVVALYTRNDADLILRCLRRGACEFLADPTAEQLRGVLDRLHRLHAPVEPAKPCKVYCLIPGKPGCGTSTLATHLAIELKHCGVGRVLLVDADVHDGAIAFLLKLRPDFHLGDAVRDRKRMDNDLWARLAVSCHGIDVLLAPDNPASPVEIDRQTALELMAFWRSRYEAIVLDTAGARYAIEFARLADEILVIATNELVALHATRRSIEYLEQSGIERRRLHLVMNRYTPATGLKREEVETALKLAPYALLVNEYESVQHAVLEGRPLPAASRFSRSVNALALRLTGKSAPPKKRSTFLGLLARKP